jgi:hypothetical protein
MLTEVRDAHNIFAVVTVMIEENFYRPETHDFTSK